MPRTQTPPDAPLLTGSAASDARLALRSGARGWGPGTPLAEGDRVSEPVFCLAFCPVWRKQVAMPLASGRLSKWGRHVHWLLVALRGVLPAPRLSSLGCRGLTPSGATVSPDGCGRLQGWNIAGEPLSPSPPLSASGVRRRGPCGPRAAASADATCDSRPVGAHAAPLTAWRPWPPRGPQASPATLRASACTVPAPPGLAHPDELGSGSPRATGRDVACRLPARSPARPAGTLA